MLALNTPPRQIPYSIAADHQESEDEKSQQANPKCQQQTMPVFSAENGGIAENTVASVGMLVAHHRFQRDSSYGAKPELESKSHGVQSERPFPGL